MRSWRKTFAAAAAAVVLSACGHVIPGRLTGDGKDFDFAKPCTAKPPEPQPIEVRYLGAGNVYIRWRDEAILIGPFFSNVGGVRAFAGFPKPNAARIEEVLATLPHIQAILAGHSHYDHIVDLPEVAKRVPGARLFVNRSAIFMLPGEGLTGTPIEPGWGDFVTPSIHVRAVASSHAPQFCGREGFPCTYAWKPVAEQWTTPWGKHRLRTFGGGDTLAFAIELRDGATTRYRIYFNDSAAKSPLGQTEGSFDLAILTAAQWNRVRDYPRDLLQVIRPRHVVVSHWENFFTTKKTQFVFRLNPEGFIETADKLAIGGGKPVNEVCGARNDKWTMPMPGASMFFTPRESHETDPARSAADGRDDVRGQ